MDLSTAIPLDNSDELIDIETNFKLCAGPGAGKTRFLINHIKNVLANSTRLTKVKKIACITYTNIGVETITNRLDNSINEVEVSTIHSFLYKNVVKPYLWILNDEYDIPLEDVDGHDEIIPTYTMLDDWTQRVNNSRFSYNILYNKEISKTEIKKRLISLQWSKKDDEIFLTQKGHPQLPIKNELLNDYLIEYKKVCWKRAKLSHDDILFFSYMILNKNNLILDILRAKFPYIFIDEFQDTSPIQSEIIKMIGEKETIIGVIGDVGQSIFSFQGANVDEFIDFDLNTELYKIEDNYRSSDKIIDILNHVRDELDFKQKSPTNKTGNLPQILIGGYFDAYNKSIEITGDENVCTLSYKNDISNIMKWGYEDYFDSEDINEPLFRDTNSDRGWLILFTITAIEYCLQNKIKDAIKYMKKAYKKIDNFGDKEALENLKRLIDNHNKYRNESIKEFYNDYLYGHYGLESKISRGRINDYYTSLEYRKIAVSVRINNDDSLHRTIHKAKGDDFNSVLVIAPSERELKFLLNPNIKDEENRVYYVALSRAIQNLFINVPELSVDNQDEVKRIGFEVVDLNNN